MEVFKVFATLSLVDMLSGPLGKIRSAMQGVDAATGGLNAKMGQLALALGPFAAGAGLVVGAFGKCVATAAGFEDQMAKVGAISRASAGDMRLLEAKARELGASTQFTAVQVGQAEQYLAMAGFSVEENLAALPGVLNLAAATATDLGRAADISSDILGAFGMKASEMTRVADVLALTCAQANTDMELLGDTMKYVAPIARKAGLSIEETAAMAGLLGDVGIKGSQAGTTMKAMLGKLAAPTKEASDLMRSLGVTTKDAAGNLRNPVQVLGELTKKMQGLGSADQIEALKKIVGEEAMAGFSELLNQADGSGKLLTKINNLLKGGGTAGEMAARQNDTLAGSVRSLGSAWESLQITVGKLFLPIVRKVVDIFTGMLRLFDSFAQSGFGAAVLKFAGALSTAVLGATAFAAGLWAIGKAAPYLGRMFLALKTSLLGLGAPVWALIAAGGLFYAAWKSDFGGIATVMSKWWSNISLVARGVMAVFQNLTGASSEIRGELAKEIKAAGLENFVVTVSRIVYRVKEFFTGIWDGLNLDGVTTVLAPAILKLRDLFERCASVISGVFGQSVSNAGSSARSLGELIGGALSWVLEGLATVIAGVATGIEGLVSFFSMLCALFRGDFVTAAQEAQNIWNAFCATLMSFADLFRIGDWIRAAWDDVTNWLASLNLFESGMKLINTLKDGILAAAGSLVESVKGVFGKVRNLLPFSDAKEGPLSTLTLSGQRLMTTIGEGVGQGFPALYGEVAGKLGTLRDGIAETWQGLGGQEIAAPMLGQPEPVTPEIAPLKSLAPPVPQIPALNGPDANSLLVESRSLLDNAVSFGKERLGGIFTGLFTGAQSIPGSIVSPLTGALSNLGDSVAATAGKLWEGIAGQPKIEPPVIPDVPGAPQDVAEARANPVQRPGEQKYFTVHIANITLPNVKDAQDFYSQLQASMSEYGESLA